ncbi:hypothetical protein [Variovorax sp. LjRoot178]|uniref:hypothetical protein n=1 Tax=Variovorax sp. LjRoot178 TaxID=3342277 RepID=UPI003ECCC059
MIVLIWIGFPLLPAWLTYRITPEQDLGLRGPFQGMTLRATGSFVAYIVVAILLSAFTWPMGKFLMGKVAGESMWVITGRAELYDENGKPTKHVPGLRMAYLRVVPEQNVIDTDLAIKVPFPRDGKPTIFIEVPEWGGAKISLNDPEAYTEDSLARRIVLKDIVQIRQTPTTRISIGE